tara:strand:+ start:458 stop:1141 length:684 start_codon:yes stop_codon:yes gene_type:complete
MKDQFERHILPILIKKKPKKILELGVLEGGATIQILKYCNENNANLVSVDPTEWTGEIPQELKTSFKGFASNVLGRSIHPKFIEEVYRLKLEKNWKCIKKTSNEFLNSSEFNGFDLCLWDADHNYFNLLRDLKNLHKKSQAGNQILIQGLSKWNRKDQYSDPESIPLEFYKGKNQGLIKAIKKFIKLTNHRRYFRTLPFFYLTKKNWKYKKITSNNHGLGILEKLND